MYHVNKWTWTKPKVNLVTGHLNLYSCMFMATDKGILLVITADRCHLITLTNSDQNCLKNIFSVSDKFHKDFYTCYWLLGVERYTVCAPQLCTFWCIKQASLLTHTLIYSCKIIYRICSSFIWIPLSSWGALIRKTFDLNGFCSTDIFSCSRNNFCSHDIWLSDFDPVT